MYHNSIESYRKTDVITSDPVRLVIMCYEGAIDSLRLAKQKIIDKDYEAKAKAIIKTQDIIDELLLSLDFEKGSEIAKNLSSLYKYMLERIMHGSLKNDIIAIDEVIGMLKELLSAWQEVASRPDSKIQPSEEHFYEDRSAMVAGHVSA